MYVYAQSMDCPHKVRIHGLDMYAQSMDCPHKVRIHGLCSAIHGLRKSILCAQHIYTNRRDYAITRRLASLTTIICSQLLCLFLLLLHCVVIRVVIIMIIMINILYLSTSNSGCSVTDTYM